MSGALRVGCYSPRQPARPGKVVLGKHFQDAAYELIRRKRVGHFVRRFRMSRNISYGRWEPVFAKVQTGLTLWRLDYLGVGEWNLRCHIPILDGENICWNIVKQGGVHTLSQWAKAIAADANDAYPENGVQRQLGVRISGSYEQRLCRLRDSLITIGWEQQCATEGGIGTSFVSRSEISIYAELGNAGGVDVWGRCTERFVGASKFSIAEDCTSMEEIESAIDNSGYSTNFINTDQLQNLLMTTWTA
jgi:hypothetical protein